MSVSILVNLDVPDLAAAEALYTTAFGLRAGRRFGAHGVELLGAQAPAQDTAPRPSGQRVERR